MLLQKEIHPIVGQLWCILKFFTYIFFIGIITTPSDLPAYLKQIVFTTHLLIHRKWLLHPMSYTCFLPLFVWYILFTFKAEVRINLLIKIILLWQIENRQI